MNGYQFVKLFLMGLLLSMILEFFGRRKCLLANIAFCGFRVMALSSMGHQGTFVIVNFIAHWTFVAAYLRIMSLFDMAIKAGSSHELLITLVTRVFSYFFRVVYLYMIRL